MSKYYAAGLERARRVYRVGRTRPLSNDDFSDATCPCNMVLKIYGHPLSPPARAVMIFARLANIEHEYVFVDLMKGEQKKPEFLAINPAGQVPAISDGDFNLSESLAILTYLCTSRRVEDHWYPADPQQRAKVDSYLHWHHSNLRRAALAVIARFFTPKETPIDPVIVSDALTQRAKALAQIESWLTANEYLTGPQPSVADLAALCEITNHRLLNLDLTPYPHIVAWVDRLFQLPQVAEAHQPQAEFKAMIEEEAKKQA